MPFKMYGVSASLLSQTRTCTKYIAPEVHFHAKSIGAGPVVTTLKMAKLFRFFPLAKSTRPYYSS